MRVVELSDHPAEMLDQVARHRQAAQRRAQDQYEDALVQYQARVQTMRVRRDRARAGHSWLEWLRLAFGVLVAKRRLPRRPQLPAATADTDTEARLRAGIEGEQRVAAELGRALSDEWTLLHGYLNRRGEIDHLLLGPSGLFAIEVKTVNATVHIDGDRWRADKYDRYGNLVEQRLIEDRKGRSPSRQLTEPAAELESFLHRRGQRVQVQRVVLLLHERSRLGVVRNPTVQAGTSVDYLLSLARASADRLDERQRAEIDRLILRDHAFHTTGRASGPGASRTTSRTTGGATSRTTGGATSRATGGAAGTRGRRGTRPRK
jgi:Nuclease-related domain